MADPTGSINGGDETNIVSGDLPENLRNPLTPEAGQESLVKKEGNHSRGLHEYGSNHVVEVEPLISPHHLSLSSGNSGNSTSQKISSTVMFHDIYYNVKTKVSPCSCTTVKKEILKDINGIFRPGMNAVMGPTGSGKTSLLDVLAGRKAPEGLSGTILLNGMPLPENFKLLVGYVAQDDVVTGTLTIRENLAFSAALRLPRGISKQEREERVEQVITELGLTEVADTKVGNEFIRGVSGGERKRCNIGMELIISPPLLFLDEPTTGLDASTANAVMMQLRKLSLRGRNIIFSIHQPRYSIFRQFDSLMLLSHGSVVYHGLSEHAIDYFKSIGYVCDQFNNPADFFLDVINGDSTAVTSNKDNGEEKTYGEVDPLILNDKYRSSSWGKKLEGELKPIMAQHVHNVNNGTLVHVKKLQYTTSFPTQLMVVSGRSIKNLLRNPAIYIMQFLVTTIFAALVGAIYFQLNDSKASGIQNRSGAFFFIIMNQVFGNLSAVELFIKERALFIHENTNGFYRVSAYFLAKVFCDVIPLRFVPSVVFSSVAYYMIGFQSGIEHFGFFSLTMFLTALSASALSFLISSSVKIFAVANLCLALCYVFMMLFSGLLINVGDLGAWISWMKYLSIFRYSLNALSINELKDQLFCGNGTSGDYDPGCVPVGNISCVPGYRYLDRQNIPYDTNWDLWQNIVALTSLAFGFLFLTYFQLLRMNKLK